MVLTAVVMVLLVMMTTPLLLLAVPQALCNERCYEEESPADVFQGALVIGEERE